MFQENRIPTTAAMPGEQHEREADAIRREVIVDAECRNPRQLLRRSTMPAVWVVVASGDRQRTARPASAAEQRNDARARASFAGRNISTSAPRKEM